MATRQDNVDVPEVPEEANSRADKRVERMKYFKSIQRRARQSTNVESQQRSARRRTESLEQKELLGVDTKEGRLSMEVCHGQRHVNRKCADTRHHLEERSQGSQAAQASGSGLPTGFFGVTHQTTHIPPSQVMLYCGLCSAYTTKEHAEEHRFQQEAAEEVDFQMDQPEVVAEEEESSERLREDLLRQARWARLNKLLHVSVAGEAEAVTAWCAAYVRTEKSFRFMRASPECTKQIVDFLRRFRETIRDDAELVMAWEERIGKQAKIQQVDLVE